MDKHSVTKLSFPHFGIQCDWEDEIRTGRRGGKSWVTIRRVGDETSIHGTLISDLDSKITTVEPFRARRGYTNNVVQVEDGVSGFQCTFIAPVSTFSNIHKKGVVSLDVSDGGLGISVCQNNYVNVWETETGNVRRTLDGHVSDVYTCRLFPSGIVALTAGADMRLKIWSLDTGTCPTTLTGHTAAVQDTCVIDRGRNVVSVSKDGTARLWDCGESKTLEVLIDCGAAINSCAVLTPTANVALGDTSPTKSDREVGTAGKLLLIGREDSVVQGVAIGSRESVFSAPVPSAANTVIATGLNTFAVGCQSGDVLTFDLRKVVPPKRIQYSTASPVLSLLAHPRSPASDPTTDEGSRLFWVAKADGTVALLNPSVEPTSKKIVQLTGADFDPIYQLKSDANYIYTACRDGIIRKYSINQVTQAMSYT